MSRTSVPEPTEGRSGSRRTTPDQRALTLLVIGLAVGIALVDFLAQNTRSVQIEFFDVSGHVPIVVALLVAALCGAALVVLVGLAHRHHFRLGRRSPALARSHVHEDPRAGEPAREGDAARPPEDEVRVEGGLNGR